MIKAILRYLLNILIWLDMGINTITFSGSPHETISSRTSKLRNTGSKLGIFACAVIDYVFGKDHCKNAEVPDFGETVNYKGSALIGVVGTIIVILYEYASVMSLAFYTMTKLQELFK
jgi:hypothetical protein